MLLLLNTTKTMDTGAPLPPGLKATDPCHPDKAVRLAGKISRMSRSRLAQLMSLSDKLARTTHTNAALWGLKNRPKIPALFGFTGLFYKSLAAETLDPDLHQNVQEQVRILSGLYGMLRPFDRVEAYRLEMGHKLIIGKTKTVAAFWKETLTAQLNEELKPGEAVISLASQEYVKALDLKKLNSPVIQPVFKEQDTGGTLKTVAVHAKKARGALVRYALANHARKPRDLKGFNAMGWKPAKEIPQAGPWLFTRPRTP